MPRIHTNPPRFAFFSSLGATQKSRSRGWKVVWYRIPRLGAEKCFAQFFSVGMKIWHETVKHDCFFKHTFSTCFLILKLWRTSIGWFQTQLSKQKLLFEGIQSSENHTTPALKSLKKSHCWCIESKWIKLGLRHTPRHSHSVCQLITPLIPLSLGSF